MQNHTLVSQVILWNSVPETRDIKLYNLFLLCYDNSSPSYRVLKVTKNYTIFFVPSIVWVVYLKKKHHTHLKFSWRCNNFSCHFPSYYWAFFTCRGNSDTKWCISTFSRNDRGWWFGKFDFSRTTGFLWNEDINY